MYQSLLPILEPIIDNGKTGVFKIVHKYGDHAHIFLRNGNIEHIKTKKFSGRKAAAACLQWVNITAEFKEGNPEEYLPDPEINTQSFISDLKKRHKTIKIINENIFDDNVVLQFDSTKLKNSSKISADAFKTILLLNGKRSIKQILSIAGKPELTVLSQICRAVLSGIATNTVPGNTVPTETSKKILKAFSEKLTSLVGPAGSALLNDALEKTNIHSASLNQEKISLLTEMINPFLEDEDQDELDTWLILYFVDNPG